MILVLYEWEGVWPEKGALQIEGRFMGQTFSPWKQRRQAIKALESFDRLSYNFI